MDIREWVADEQARLWDDFHKALRRAINGVWSIECESLAWRIIQCARLVGPTSYGAMNWDLVVGGVYEAVLEQGGVTPKMPDPTERARLDALMAGHVNPDAVKNYAATVRGIRALPSGWADG